MKILFNFYYNPCCGNDKIYIYNYGGRIYFFLPWGYLPGLLLTVIKGHIFCEMYVKICR